MKWLYLFFSSECLMSVILFYRRPKMNESLLQTFAYDSHRGVHQLNSGDSTYQLTIGMFQLVIPSVTSWWCQTAIYCIRWRRMLGQRQSYFQCVPVNLDKVIKKMYKKHDIKIWILFELICDFVFVVLEFLAF